MVGIVYEDKQSDIARHIERMSPNLTEPGLTTGDLNLSTNTTTTNVTTGIYVDQISDFSLSDSTGTVDFHIWFKWNGSNVNSGENLQIVDGNILKKEKRMIIPMDQNITKFTMLRPKSTNFSMS